MTYPEIGPDGDYHGQHDAGNSALGIADRESAGFDAALAGVAERLELTDGRQVRMAVRRWHSAADSNDRWLLERCHGLVIDLGCGPGRFVHALTTRGVPALGVDVSPWAVRHCRARGAAVLQGDALGWLPGAGGWRHVLLADGNIGIGGDPATLLRRAAALLGPTGTVLVEIEPTDSGLWRGGARLRSPSKTGPWFPWAMVGPDALRAVAAAAGLRPGITWQCRHRCFAELHRERL